MRTARRRPGSGRPCRPPWERPSRHRGSALHRGLCTKLLKLDLTNAAEGAGRRGSCLDRSGARAGRRLRPGAFLRACFHGLGPAGRGFARSSLDRGGVLERTRQALAGASRRASLRDGGLRRGSRARDRLRARRAPPCETRGARRAPGSPRGGLRRLPHHNGWGPPSESPVQLET